jgi:regulator of replication initiation timing
LTTELERIKILEGKISQVVDYIHKLTAENDKLKSQLKERLDEDVKKYEGEREVVKGKIEAIINQIDQLGL